jgi:hypothetical protein
MDNKEKIELMRRRIEFFYNEHRINARKHHHNHFYFFKDFTEFCQENFVIVDYCFYLGEYCKDNRKWLSDYKRWEQYKYNDEIIRRMSCILEGLVIETLFEHQDKGKERLEEIRYRLQERWFSNGATNDELIYKNGRRYLIYAFMTGLMNVTDDEIDKFWEFQYELIERDEDEAYELLSDLRYASYQDHYDTDYTPENAVMDALKNGNGELLGF